MLSLYIFILLVFALPIAAYANPIIVDISPYAESGADYMYIFYKAVTALLIEYLLVRRLLYPQGKFRYVLPAFIVINLITYPITLIASWYVIYLAELIPLICEPLLYKWYFRWIKVEVPHLTIKIIVANLVSFVVGGILSGFLPTYFFEFILKPYY
jgi:hypothetical protein